MPKSKTTAVPLVRPLTRKMAERLRVLVDACSLMENDERIILFAAVRNTAEPFLNLTSELILLLCGHKPSAESVCKEIQMAAKPKKRRKQIIYGPPPSSILERRKRNKDSAKEIREFLNRSDARTK